MTTLNRLALIVLLLAPLAACSDPTPPLSRGTEGRKEMPNDFIKVECEPSVHPFWKKFRAAALAEDAQAVADMAWFPVRVDDPLRIDDVELSRAEFIERFPQFLKAKPYSGSPGEKSSSTMKELLKESPTLAKDACYTFKTMLVFNRWMFQLSGENRWKLDSVSALDEADPNDDRVVFCKPSIHPFWMKFRAAILAEDAEAVADMAEFPLGIASAKEIQGETISRAEFIKRFPQFLNAPTEGNYGRDNTRTMKELVKNIPTLDKDACGDFEGMLPFDRWTFHLTPEGWRLNSVETRTFTK